MRAWGLKAVDEEFVVQNGAQCGSEKVVRLMKLLSFEPLSALEADNAAHLRALCNAARRYGAQMVDSMRISAVAEVIQALGLSGPFDLYRH